MARSKKNAGRVVGVMLGILALVVVAGAATYLVGRGTPQVQVQKPAMETVNTHKMNSAPEKPDKQTVKIYVVKVTNEDAVLVPKEVTVASGTGKYHTAMSALLEEAGSATSAIPKGTRINSVEVTGDMAILDLSKEFVDNFNGGSRAESLAINAITRTMAQFPEIKKVQILVEGKKIGSLGGHFELDEPIDVEP